MTAADADESLTPAVTESDAHPGGACTQAHMRCGGCGLPAPIAVRYGGPMADCRHCAYAWAVHHDPELCWLRSNFFDGRPDAEALVAVRVREAAPLLIAACAVLGDLVDTL